MAETEEAAIAARQETTPNRSTPVVRDWGRRVLDVAVCPTTSRSRGASYRTDYL
jgi:hypothetical protein